MAALTKDRSTPARNGDYLSAPMKGGSKIFKGALVVLDGGYAAPGHVAAGLVAIGRAHGSMDNSAGADGDLNIVVARGDLYRFDNLATDLVARTQIGSVCYVVDDATVAATHAGDTRSIAGKVVDVDDDGVWVSFK